MTRTFLSWCRLKEKIFRINPEVAGGQQLYRITADEEYINSSRAIFKDSLSEAKRLSDKWDGHWKGDLNASLLQRNRGAWGLLLMCSCWYILVADEETSRTNELLLFYFDDKHNVVAQGRLLIDNECIDQTTMYWGRGIPSFDAFEYGSLGEKYLIDGEIGRELYQLTKEDLE
ncbi:hypothetical protein BDV19DRAFT_395150 [Aspergillus venezuelensis]